MGFRLFRRERERGVSLDELKAILQREIDEHEREIEKFAEENFSKLKEAVDGLVKEVELFDIQNLPLRLRGVAKNFISMMEKQWRIEEEKPIKFFQDVELKTAKLALSIKKSYRILFVIKIPGMEGINQKIREITSLISAFEELRGNQAVLLKRKILEKIEQLDEIERSLEELEKKIESLEMEENLFEDLDEEEELSEYRAREEELLKQISALEEDLQKKIGVIRKPLRIYAHMIGEKLDLTGYRDLERESIQRIAGKARDQIVRGVLKVKLSQKDSILKGLDFVARGEASRIVREIDNLKREFSAVQARIKTIGSKKRAKIAGKKQRIERELSSIKGQMESYNKRRDDLLREIKELCSSLPYRLLIR
jgi:hypothetical protein